MGYPKQMYKGSHTPDKINAEERVANDEKEEKNARKDGFVDGKEFFAQAPAKPEPIKPTPAPAPVPPTPAPAK